MKILPDFKEFSSKHSKGIKQLVWAKLPADLDTPVSVAMQLGEEEFCSLFESVEGGKNRGRYSFITVDPDLIWRCVAGQPEINRNANCDLDSFEKDKEKDVFASLRKIIAESKLDIPSALPAMSSGLFGYFSYDMVRYMEKIPNKNPEVINIPESLFIRPRIIIIFDSVKDEMSVVAPVFKYSSSAQGDYDEAVERITRIAHKLSGIVINKNYEHCLNEKAAKKYSQDELEKASNTSRKEYYEMVEKAKEYILAGDIFQVVLAQRFALDFPYEAFSLYRVLRSINPSPYSFYVKMRDFALVGSSPEILVRAKGGKVTVRPIAGTRKRGESETEDKNLEADLLRDEKELAEHLMLIDLGRNDVGRVAKMGSVKVTEQMVIERYSHVMHIVSNVEGVLKPECDALDAVIAGFPVGTVSGAPKIRSMEIIDELEKERRSFYAGGVGYFSSNGDVDTCIALRTGLVKDGKLYIQAGGGVVADSTPEGEYQESCNKARALVSAAEIVASVSET